VEKEREGRCYRGNTVLTLDMAYSNARLLARNAASSLAERGAARAALVYSMAYTARCEHSDALTDFSHHPPQTANQLSVPPDEAKIFLTDHATHVLTNRLRIEDPHESGQMQLF
jgi:hypothetical protein